MKNPIEAGNSFPSGRRLINVLLHEVLEPEELNVKFPVPRQSVSQWAVSRYDRYDRSCGWPIPWR